MSAPRITKDWLFWEHPEVDLVRKRERTGSPIVPRLIVIHYGVTSALPELVAAQRARGYWAHLSIDGCASEGPNYLVHQALPFNERGSHAGESNWRGRDQCNSFSIGIEIANPGPLIRGTDGKLRTVYDKEWPEEDAVEAKHAGGRAPQNWTHWAAYADQEYDILIGVISALCKTYHIEGIAGHDEIAPHRKYDPGPAFSMDWLRSKFGFAA